MSTDRLALDRALIGAGVRDYANRFALDRAQNRTVDPDGHMHVKESIVSRAEVSPYVGREIPGCDELGLDPGRIYQLLRDPKELEAGADSLNGKPLLFIHKPISSDEHPFNEVVGAVFNPIFDNGELKAELVVWPGKAREAIDSETHRCLSCGYAYTPRMQSGTFEGKHYDGIMTEIRFNHCALVEEGRVKGAIVGDEQPKEIEMAKTLLSRKAVAVQGGVFAYLAPRLAQDARIDLTPAFKGVTAQNYAARRASLVAGITALAKPKLAQDADLEGLAELVDAFQKVDPAEAAPGEEAPVAGVPEGAPEGEGLNLPDPKDDDSTPLEGDAPEEEAKDADPVEQIKALLAGKIDDETMAQLDQILVAIGEAGQKHEAAESEAPAEDTDGNSGGESPSGSSGSSGLSGSAPSSGGPDTPKYGEDKDMVSKPAMDAAIDVAVKRERQAAKDLREAERFVRPWIGELSIVHDSAISVLRATAKSLEIPNADKLDALALKTAIGLIPQPGARPKVKNPFAQDSAEVASLAERFPNFNRLKK